MNVASSAPTPHRTGVFFALLLFWVLLSGSLAPSTLGVGVLVAAVIAWLMPGAMSFFTDFRFSGQAVQAAIAYFGYFLLALVKANLRVAGLVLSPALPINPGFVKVHTRLKSPMGRLLLANSITLTPGTLTVEIEGEWLYVHWVTADTPDIEGATHEIVEGFEQYLEVMYG